MDCSTGKIYTAEEMKKMNRDLVTVDNRFVEVDLSEMTPKQKDTLKVSTHDFKSVLGMRLSKRRNDPCPCGSGKKFKHCCLPS